jgi:UDP-2,3-diacylglucosamine pyrophosphatase LpxH
MRRLLTLLVLAAAVLAAVLAAPAHGPAPAGPGAFRFVLLGDRTGEAQPGVWERVWHDAAAESPTFFLGVGDTIQGGDDATAESEWRQAERTLAPYARFPLYLAPGNHDVWSAPSEALYRQYSRRPLHYSFDHGPAHFTVLDNSRTDQFSPEELAFLEADLQQHQAQPVKFIVSHRPSWIIDAAIRNTAFALHQLARKYGVKYVLAGHVHQLLHLDLEGVTYLSLPSAGGHLRMSAQYQDGWFFAYTLVTVHGAEVGITIHELNAPYGQGRLTSLADWGLTGLSVRP